MYNILFVLYYAVSIYRAIVVLSFIASWLPQIWESPVGQFLNKITRPFVQIFVKPVNKSARLRNLPISIGSLLALVALSLLERLIVISMTML